MYDPFRCCVSVSLYTVLNRVVSRCLGNSFLCVATAEWRHTTHRSNNVRARECSEATAGPARRSRVSRRNEGRKPSCVIYHPLFVPATDLPIVSAAIYSLLERRPILVGSENRQRKHRGAGPGRSFEGTPVHSPSAC